MSFNVGALPRGPYGTNEGDVWLGTDSVVGKMLLERDGLTMIHEMLRVDGKVEERIYSTKEPDLIARATKGHRLYVAQKASEN